VGIVVREVVVGCRGEEGARDWALAIGEEEEGLNAKIAKGSKGRRRGGVNAEGAEITQRTQRGRWG